MSPIISDDLEYRYSGGATNDNPSASLGGTLSSETIPDDTLHAIFDVVTGDEGAAGDVEYRGIYIVNTHDTLTLIAAKLWVTSQPSGDSAIAIALADEAAGQNMETIANEQTAPDGPSFSAPSSKGSGLTIGDLEPGQQKGIWIRRTVDEGAAAQNDAEFTITVEGDSEA